MPENLYRRGNIWWARVQTGGREHRRSLRTASKAEARQRLARILDEVKHKRFYGEDRHTWKEAVVEWTKAAMGQIAPSTMKRYFVSIGQVRHILDGLYVDQIDRSHISKIARRPGPSNATRRRDLTAVSTVLAWCVSHDWREDNPAKEWDRDAIKERRDPILLPEPYDIDCAVAEAPDNFAKLIRWAQYTGMRQDECGGLERPQVDPRRAAANLSKTKTNRPRSVPLDERAIGTFVGTVPHISGPFVFWHGDGQRYANISSRFVEFMKRAQKTAAEAKRPVPRKFRFHDLRHWYAVDYLRRGGNIYDLQLILGHSSIKTTEIYLDYLTPDEQMESKGHVAQREERR